MNRLLNVFFLLLKMSEPQYQEFQKSRDGQLVSKNCVVCGTSKTYNGALVDIGDESYHVRVCSNPDCRETIYSEDMNPIITKGGSSKKSGASGNGIRHNPVKL